MNNRCDSTRRYSGRLSSATALCVFLLAGLPQAVLAIDEAKVAGIVYNETSGLRPISGKEDQFQDGREKLAEVAYKRDGEGMATSKTPSAEELKSPPRQGRVGGQPEGRERCQGQGRRRLQTCFYLAFGGYGQDPRQDAQDLWDSELAVRRSGQDQVRLRPDQVPQKGRRLGDVPKSDTVYIFIYCGVK